MGEKTFVRQATKIVFLCVCWYTISATNNVIIKKIFQVFPHPMTVTMVHLLAVCAFLGPTLTVLNVEPTPYVSRRFFLRIMVPLAIGKLFASLSGHVSILKVPLSYAHTGIIQIILMYKQSIQLVRDQSMHMSRPYCGAEPVGHYVFSVQHGKLGVALVRVYNCRDVQNSS